jgi:Glyoxalase/Bleomycin resistance protein/Dioxygenase superfamily
MRIQFGPLMQHGYIVADVEKSAREWAECVGAGPFYVLDRNRMDNYYYRGVRMEVETRLAFGYWHGVQVELIQPLDNADSLYNRALRSCAGQLNHMAVIVSDLNGLLARHKLEQRVIQRGDMASGVKFVYLEEYLPGGHHLELIDAPQSTLMAFAGMQKVARQWDGRNAIRPMSQVGKDLAALGS